MREKARKSLRKLYSRRSFLGRLGGILAAVAGTAVLGVKFGGRTGGVELDSSGGPPRPPPPSAHFSGNVSLPAGFTVPAGETWNFDPAVSTTVTVSANVIVNGVLQMRPANAGIIHTLRFTGVNEANFVGGGMDPIASDVGLWVMGAGKLDLQGSAKVPWNRTGTDPTWTGSDELKVTPVTPGNYTSAPFTLGGAVPSWNGHVAEVLNLTRNVRIEGTATGRSHIFIRSTVAQTVNNTAIRYMGPRKGTPSALVLGRYGLHFHHCSNGSNGSHIDNTVIRDIGSWGLVPHDSQGTSATGTIVYSCMGDAFTWDYGELTSNTLWDGCVAAELEGPAGQAVFTQSGFTLGRGSGNICRNSVAVTNRGGYPGSPGFNWPEGANGAPNVWTFDNNLAHNNNRNGIWVWQNDANSHVITNHTSYLNGVSEIDHGAYENCYQYRDMVLEGAALEAVLQHALGPDPNGSPPASQLPPHVFERITLRGRGVTPNAIRATATVSSHGSPVTYKEWTIDGLTGKAFVVENGATVGGFLKGLYDFVRCTVNGADFEPTNVQIISAVAGTRIRSQRRNGTAWQMDYQGNVTTIPPFAP
jgi:hypothetical protein